MQKCKTVENTACRSRLTDCMHARAFDAAEQSDILFEQSSRQYIVGRIDKQLECFEVRLRVIRAVLRHSVRTCCFDR